ncbi:MAG: hypothetical protein ABJC13_07855 [Acidobacteriota bacterium]
MKVRWLLYSGEAVQLCFDGYWLADIADDWNRDPPRLGRKTPRERGQAETREALGFSLSWGEGRLIVHEGIRDLSQRSPYARTLCGWRI